MKKILLSLLLFFLILYSFAQTSGLQNLREQLSKHPQQDTSYVNLLNNFLLKRNSLSLQQNDSIASVEFSVAKRLNYTRGIMQALISLSSAKRHLGSNQQAIDFAQQAVSMAEKTGDQEMQVRAMMAIAISKELTTDPESGLNDLLKAEGIAENLPDKKLLADCQTLIASIYGNALSNFPKAMEWLIKAIHTSEPIKYLSGLETSWQTMGDLYANLGDYQKALLYDAKALQASDSLGIKNSSLQNSLGENYRLSGKYPDAIAAYQKAIAMDKTPYDIELYQSNIADVYVKLNDLPNAFNYAFTSLRSAKKLNDLSGEAWIENILARAYLKKNMEDSALVYATKGLQAAQQSNYLEFLRDNTGTLADIYANKKDFEKAYTYHLQYIIYRDSMVNAEVSNKANLMQYDYSMAKTQAKITALNAQKKSQRNLLITAVSILALIVLISILLLRNNRQKQKANKLLQQQKQEIDAKAQNVELLSEIGRKITASLSVEKIIGTVYDNVNSLMDANVFGIGIYNDALKRIDFPATYEKGAALPFYSNSIDDQNRFGTVCFKSGKEIIINNLNDEYKEHIQEIETPDEGGTPASIIFLPLIAKGEKLGVITVQSFQKNAYSDYQLYMFRNIATYTSIAIDNAESFETLNTTFSTLKSTQTQLIQSEKMASLGELTAGIAHEIQNPLNFVNNFSEVNTELIDELEEEAKKGNIDGVKALANDIKKNEQRINHHGKRAGEIVKGMLQHSRSSTGVKEPTDINALCDEYVRLAYHGLKAKDKSFNAKFETDFDKSIPKINIVLQDIGRVVLNLINNSFYAVSEKKKHQPGSYEPTVTLSTKKETGKILISVKDNGSGIPKKIVDKIFQPFFTTKPTGSGTGLGLSLSYDIVKANGGEIKVESEEGEGTEFIVELPVV